MVKEAQTIVVLMVPMLLSQIATNRSYKYLHMTLQLLRIPQNIIHTNHYFKISVIVVFNVLVSTNITM